MNYIVSEDTKISGKCDLRSVDLRTSQSASLSVDLSILDRHTNFSQPVSLSVLDRQTDLNNIYIYIMFYIIP